MGEYLDLPAKVSPSLIEEKGHAGITLDNYQILPPSSNHIYTLRAEESNDFWKSVHRSAKLILHQLRWRPYCFSCMRVLSEHRQICFLVIAATTIFTVYCLT